MVPPLTTRAPAPAARPNSADFTGSAEERGAGAGLGFTLNIPLPPGTADDAYCAALARAADAIRACPAAIAAVIVRCVRGAVRCGLGGVG